ncbi:hypothetical protein, partial [Mycobacterium kyogaense]|uniref:hypothetical protein n=1 Tax=Mycobacterium kyogaense TaxID=2212479 RepID=UPI001969408F
KQKLPIQDRAESESEKSDHKHQKHLAKKRCAPKRENADTTKKQQTKTTKHTIEFSNNIAVFRQPCHCTACDQGGQAPTSGLSTGVIGL